MMTLQNYSRKGRQEAIDATKVVSMSHRVKMMSNFTCQAFEQKQSPEVFHAKSCS